MTLYYVTFKYSDNTYCSNLALAEDVETVKEHYGSKYPWHDIRPATDNEIAMAIRKDMPIVKLI